MEKIVDVERLNRHLSEVAWAPTVEISRTELLALLSRLEQAEQAASTLEQDRDYWKASALGSEQAVARVREVHRPVDVEPSETICHACSTLRGNGDSLRYFPYKEWPCDTIRALDGDGW